LPKSAIEVLRREGKDTAKNFEELASKAISLEKTANPVVAPPSLATSSVPTVAISGKTTFQELISAGYVLSEIEAIVGVPNDLNMTIKDFVAEKGIEFSEMKAELALLTPKK
jgi:hypothetical protein